MYPIILPSHETFFWKIDVGEGTYLQNISDNIIFVYGDSRQST